MVEESSSEYVRQMSFVCVCVDGDTFSFRKVCAVIRGKGVGSIQVGSSPELKGYMAKNGAENHRYPTEK